MIERTVLFVVIFSQNLRCSFRVLEKLEGVGLCSQSVGLPPRVCPPRDRVDGFPRLEPGWVVDEEEGGETGGRYGWSLVFRCWLKLRFSWWVAGEVRFFSNVLASFFGILEIVLDVEVEEGMRFAK